jgi:hypothetical protein
MRAFTLSMVLSIGFLALSVVAMRRRRLRQQSALLWLSVSLVMVFLSATLPLHLLDRVARLLGIAYPPDLLLLLAVLFLFVLVFHLSLSLDRLSAKQTSIAQEVGLANVSSTPVAGADERREPTGPGASWA